ncbi:hypothetical protein [Bacteroides thetaiotaomicron]|uniref:hypothetical protein n=1 Tax=Bacteroides thetaiotaomicron TaxID=818 RepID=UPI00101D0237|nr:hypothetical protein [Bacteroides thetaiotaomicron]
MKLNKLSLNTVGLNRIGLNRIGLPSYGSSSGSARPYIDPELLSHVKMAISTWGKTNDDPDRAVLKDLSGNGNDMRLLNFGFVGNSGYGLPGTDFEGWLCTDGVDDMIVSEKTVDEMIGDSKECTVISIISYISDIGSNHANILGKRFIRNMFERDGINGKYYICGYTSTNIDEIGNVTVVNDILGDKTDFVASYPIASGVADYFSVTGYLNTDNVPQKCIKIAYAGGFIANKVLTTDEINQIIAYFNLDRPGQIIKPQLYCNIKKQGITNDNHAEFNDQLIDFVGGHNIQLNNVAWKGESGIGKYNVDFDSWIPQFNIADSVHASNKLCVTRIKAPQAILYTRAKVNSMKVEVKGSQSLELFYQYVDKDDNMILLSLQGDGIYDLPASIASANNYYTGFRVSNYTGECDITITQIPENPDALHLDGISDFGKATGLPILKDYTICALRKWLYDDSVTSIETGSIVSKSRGAFILEQTLSLNSVRCGTWNFGTFNALEGCDKLIEESFTYQTKYSYNGNSIQPGTVVDSDSIWLGTIRDGDSRFSKFALWSLMLFPYSLSEFLLERQLRKYKAGTLYPDMIEFRPVIKSNVPYSSISYSVNPGVYVAEGSMITITITLSNASDKLIGVSSNAISDISISGDNGVYEVTGKVAKSPQKINITINENI